MNQIEKLREKLYRIIETGNIDEILNISMELDKLILHYYSEKSTNSSSKKTA